MRSLREKLYIVVYREILSDDGRRRDIFRYLQIILLHVPRHSIFLSRGPGQKPSGKRTIGIGSRLGG